MSHGSEQFRLIRDWFRGLAARCATGDGAAKQTLEAFDEIVIAQRAAGRFGATQSSEASLILGVRAQELGHSIQAQSIQNRFGG